METGSVTPPIDPKLSNAAIDDVDDENDDEDDPVTATYPVFINPALPMGRRLLVLQHPNRTDDAPRPPPTELRLKAHAGMVEVDVPLDYSVAYDQEKGVKWGKTLQASMLAKNGGSHGLAGGFGVGGVQARSGGRKKNEEEEEPLEWDEARRQDKILRTQTLGGQYPEYREVQYMVGVFQGKDLHLTPVSSLVHLRPQLHHIDAATQLERQSAAGSKEGSGGASGAAPKAIHMTIKTTADGSSVTTETIADRLRRVQGEHWRKLRHTDENEEAAWEVYNESLFLQPPHEEGVEKKPKDPEEDDGPLEDAVPKFGIRWDDKQLLEAVSGIEKPEPEPPVVVVKPEPKPDLPPIAPAPAALPEEVRRPKMRPRGGAATGVARRGGRARAMSKTVDIE